MLTRKSNLAVFGLILPSVFLAGVFVNSLTAINCKAEEPPKDSQLKELRKQRLAILKEVASQSKEALRIDPSVSPSEVSVANRAVFQAELELCDTDKQRVAVLEGWLISAKDWENYVERLHTSKSVASREVLRAKVERLEVEIALQQVKGK
jgi:hypothetical protein